MTITLNLPERIEFMIWDLKLDSAFESLARRSSAIAPLAGDPEVHELLLTGDDGESYTRSLFASCIAEDDRGVQAFVTTERSLVVYSKADRSLSDHGDAQYGPAEALSEVLRVALETDAYVAAMEALAIKAPTDL